MSDSITDLADTQVELSKEAVAHEFDGGSSAGNSEPVEGAALLKNGHGDGAAHVERTNELDADANILGVNDPYTDSGDEGDSAHETDEAAKAELREPSKGEAALHYAAEFKCYVFPLHYIREDGSCSCGNSKCKSPGKHPLTRHGVKDATLDSEKIREWWQRWPDANIGIATGPSKLLVIDLDQKPEKGKDGAKAWAKLQAEHEQAPETLTQITGSGGEHLIFDCGWYEGEIGSWSSKDGLDGRADGGYIVVAPGRNADGPYRWKDPSVRVAPAPEWLCKWAANRAGGGKKDKASNKTKVKEANQADVKPVNQPVDHSVGHDEEARAISALKALPQSICYERGFWGKFGWGNVNGALYESGLPNARALADEWSQGSAACGGPHGFAGPSDPSLYSQAEQDRLWESFSKPHNRARTTMLSVYYYARQNGWIDPVKTYHFTDKGNSERLADRHGLNIRYVVELKKWIVWNGVRWVIDKTFQVERLAKETIEAMHKEVANNPGMPEREKLSKHAFKSEASKHIKAMVDLTKSEKGIAISEKILDANPWLLGVENGVIELDRKAKTYLFREGRHEDYITMSTGFEYIPTTTCPNWLKFMDRIFSGNNALIDYMKRFDGYGLTGSVEEEVMRILHGIGNNGKTTYREAKKAALGAYSLTSGLDLLLQKEHRGGATPEIAQLKGKRHTAVNETKQNQTISSQRIKNITSNEEMEGRLLKENLIQFMPTHKTDITTNHKPKITEDDEGTWRRVHLIPFEITIPEEEKVKYFKDRYIIPELPGILNWMLDGFVEWCKQGLNPPQEVLAATREYREDQDIVQQWIKENCYLDPDVSTTTGELYADFKEFVRAEEGPKADIPTQRQFGDKLRAKGYERDETNNCKPRKGIALNVHALSRAKGLDGGLFDIAGLDLENLPARSG